MSPCSLTCVFDRPSDFSARPKLAPPMMLFDGSILRRRTPLVRRTAPATIRIESLTPRRRTCWSQKFRVERALTRRTGGLRGIGEEIVGWLRQSIVCSIVLVGTFVARLLGRPGVENERGAETGAPPQTGFSYIFNLLASLRLVLVLKEFTPSAEGLPFVWRSTRGVQAGGPLLPMASIAAPLLPGRDLRHGLPGHFTLGWRGPVEPWLDPRL